MANDAADETKFDLEGYLTNGVANIVKGALRASLSNPRESAFMLRYARAEKKASKIRHRYEKRGEHIPPFLIASITSSCNLHCEGCYARSMDSCSDEAPIAQMDQGSWGKVFEESARLGIAFIILAGGEPLLRKDVIIKAAENPRILFPVITNGTLIKSDYLAIFDRHRNLVPVLSVEGNEKTTDTRRGEGVFATLDKTMGELKDAGIIFGVSVTVTKRNIEEVFSEGFVNGLYEKGCKLFFYVEYVPVARDTEDLAPGDGERRYIEENVMRHRRALEDVVFVTFPGDEKSARGCLASGRGFFHINSHGGAEPCPFSPYSDANVRDVGVLGALHSKLFENLRASELQSENHAGGCALFGRDEEVKKLMGERSDLGNS